MKALIEKQKEAKELRKQGWSENEIARKLNVCKSSISNWVRHVELSDEQKIKLMKKNNRTRKSYQSSSKDWIAKHQLLREEYQKIGRDKIKNGASIKYINGCMLYWAEGSKKRNTLQFCNSDMYMMKMFVNFLKEELKVDRKDITICTNCYVNNGLSLGDIEQFWIEWLDLPKESLRKSHVKYGTDSNRHNILKYGICRVTVNNTKLVQEIFGAIQEYAGFDNPDWIK